jgi:hypothetical protein
MVRTALVIFGLFEMCVRILLLRVCWLALLCTIIVCVWIWERVVWASAALSKWVGKGV